MSTESPKKKRAHGATCYDTYIFHSKRRKPQHAYVVVDSSLKSAEAVRTTVLDFLALLGARKDDDSRHQVMKTIATFAADLEFYIDSAGDIEEHRVFYDRLRDLIGEEKQHWLPMLEDTPLPLAIDWPVGALFLLNCDA